jgi:hypothetical protein
MVLEDAVGGAGWGGRAVRGADGSVHRLELPIRFDPLYSAQKVVPSLPALSALDHQSGLVELVEAHHDGGLATASSRRRQLERYSRREDSVTGAPVQSVCPPCSGSIRA